MMIYQSPILLIYGIVLSFIIGSVAGSFLNCVAYRITKGESFVKGRSHCPICGHTLGIRDLVPFFSWVFQKGKCRYCKTKISARYPITELVMAVASVLTLLSCDFSIVALRNWLFVCCLFTLSLVDLDIQEIPNGILIVAVVVWAVSLPFMEEPMSALKYGLIAAFAFGIGLLLLSLLFDRVLGKESLGGGDIKLVFVCGLYLGSVRTLFMILLACVIGLIYVLVIKKSGKGTHFPFGPSLALATFILLLYGQNFVDWYLRLL